MAAIKTMLPAETFAAQIPAEPRGSGWSLWRCPESMAEGFNFEAVVDAVATAVANKLRAQLGSTPESAVVQPRLMSVEAAAIYLGRTKPAVQHMIAEGSLPTVRTDRRVFLDRQDLDKWIERNKV
jgi:excisionase family DNA binding protein